VLSVSRLTVAFDGRPVLSDVTCTVETGSRTALVGPNGVGKTTLLRVAAGLEVPDAGTVAVAPGASVAYVPQDYALVGAGTADAYLRERLGLAGVERELAAAEARLAGGLQADAVAYAELVERYAALGGYEADARIERALRDVGLPPSVRERPVGSLSGGQQVRLGLAGILASRHDLYLLDEPTNNLDLEGLDMLERFLAGTDATVLVVSHDRAFLEAVATDVVEIDEHDRSVTSYGVSFAEYQTLRTQALAARSARYQAYVAEVDRLTAAARTQRTAAARVRDRRPARDNDKVARHFLTQRQSRQAGRVLAALEQRLARLESVEAPRTGWELRLSLAAATRGGDRVLDAEGVTKRYGEFRLGPVDLAVRRGERVALQGHNGAGKSVLLSLLVGDVAPDAGTVRLGAGVTVGVLRQGGPQAASPDRVLDVFRRATGMPEDEARTLLAKFDLGAAHVLRPAASCSPGERCRLGLAVLMARGANLLVLDEPTNHLDLEAAEELEQALHGYQGTLLVVSHDRAFLDRVGIDRRVTLADGRLLADVPA
jgi:ATPase subunit of ABC transporter with duplicated ATPase domains